MANKKVNKEKKRYATHVTTFTGDRVYVSAKSQEELDKKVAQLKLEMGVGVDISDNTTFEEFADLWLRVYKAPRIRESTYQLLEGRLRNTVKPAFKGMKLKEIKPIHIQSFLASISRYCRGSQSNFLSIVRQIFSTAEDNGLIYKSPVRNMDRPTGDKTREKVPLTNEQACRLLASVKDTPAHLFCLIALSTGMRRGEIMGLMWEDVDFDAGYINVTHNLVRLKDPKQVAVTTDLKTEASRRRLPMPLPLRCALEEKKRQSNSRYVFARPDGSPPQFQTFGLIWRHVQARTADEKHPLGMKRRTNGVGYFTVDLDFPCSAHLLRHTYITQLFEAGLDIKQVQYLSGHATPDMTMKVYTHYRKTQRDQETTNQVLAAVSYLDAPEKRNSKVIALRA